MSVATNLPVESIEQLSSAVQRAVTDLGGQLETLRQQCQRDPNFTGNAAQRYDEAMAKWDTSQKNLLEALRSVGDLLNQFAARLRELNEAAASQFNL